MKPLTEPGDVTVPGHGLSEMMAAQRTDMAAQRTELAYQRNRFAADRTLMAIMRTSLSMIGFGFTIFSFFNSFSLYQMRVDHGSCTRCDRCRENCPMDISIWQNERSVDCIRCLECTACPVVSYQTVFERPAAAAPADLPAPAGARANA
jgi:uncharacterized membrane protein YidH (DUF202 family)